MDSILQTGGDINKKTFFNHVFSTTEEGKAEFLNVIQYSLLGVIPVVLLNKLVQRFIPEADTDKSSVELLAEILLQLVIMFCGIILVHRVITYIPTYSGFKYESLSLTNAILLFLVLVLSIQTKMGIKVNILADRVMDLWNGEDSRDRKQNVRKHVRIGSSGSNHVSSQADYLDNSGMQTSVFPPAPVAATNAGSNSGYDMMMRMGGGAASSPMDTYMGPVAANGLLGGSFGSSF
jgi:hypothetical protein